MTRTKASVVLLEESLRESEFAGIEFRDSIVGRRPYLKGSGLTVWELIMIAKSFKFDIDRIAEAYLLQVHIIQSAINYYEAHREEIDQAIADNNIGFEAIKKKYPNMELFEFNDSLDSAE